MSFSRAFQWYHSHLDPIWPDGTFKQIFFSRDYLLAKFSDEIMYPRANAHNFFYILRNWSYSILLMLILTLLSRSSVVSMLCNTDILISLHIGTPPLRQRPWRRRGRMQRWVNENPVEVLQRGRDEVCKWDIRDIIYICVPFSFPLYEANHWQNHMDNGPIWNMLGEKKRFFVLFFSKVSTIRAPLHAGSIEKSVLVR